MDNSSTDTREELYKVLDLIQPNKNGCLIYPGFRAKFKSGYRVYVLSLERKLGRKINKNMIVCHKCNDPNCVNPYHLYEGTYEDNARDKLIAGNANRGDNHWLRKQSGRRIFLRDRELKKPPNAILTENQVLEIVRLWQQEKLLQKDIAKLFGIKPKTVGKIVNGYTWGWLTRIGVRYE
jgi:hypothetical protein